MNDTLTQLGLGGVIALLIIREVLGFLKTRKQTNDGPVRVSGEQPAEYWQAEIRRAVADVMVGTVIPILSSQVTILNELRQSNTEMAQRMAIILDRMTQSK